MHTYAGYKKSHYREIFSEESDRLFNYAWKRFLWYCRNLITVKYENEVIDMINAIISDAVNDPRSKFYIYG